MNESLITLVNNRHELNDGDSRVLLVNIQGQQKEVFVIYKNNTYVAYQNSCPHTGGPLNWQPDVFLNIDETHIQCSTHLALFRLEDGFCVAGPCQGQSLKKITTFIDGEKILGEPGDS
jgi:nitrite reductase/ring-hydroxylating ferredoxin subunit